MPQSREDRLQRAREILCVNPNIGRFKLASRMGITTDVARHLLSELRGSNSSQPANAVGQKFAESVEERGDQLSVVLDGVRIKTLDELIAYAQIDTTKWECERFIANKWEVGFHDKATEQLFQIKAWFKKKTVELAIRQEIQAMIEDAKKKAPRLPAIKRPANRVDGDILVEISPMDHHFGSMSHGKETGWEDYDTKLATEVWWESIGDIVYRTKQYAPAKILFVLGNDLFHVDNSENATVHGTKQDVDSRYHKTFTTVREITCDAIRVLREVAPVDVKMIQGNHDFHAVYHLGDALRCYFHNASDVTIDNEPTLRKYYEWGNVMLMLTHGDKIKPDRYPAIMASEQPSMFSRTLIRETHLGHIHKQSVIADEFNGVKIRVLPSLCPPNAWASMMGFVGNIRSTEAFIWSKLNGLLGTAIFSKLSDRRD